MSQAKFEIYRSEKNSEYYFRLKAANGKIILSSEGYKAKYSCENGIASVKNNAPHDARYDKKTNKAGQYYFNLKAGNGEIIGTSESYTTADSRDQGIETVKSVAPDAVIEELS
ncbi:YegP family protein [Terrimonas sp. NA20]|uniref:YegP family protein n=1 Tax=Terrimonas ginsenosidimutans TaxID=2908004 RepID=A0ABS9KKA3_9BACT|nr:YegP family protein [Terrimonas ginsenosidimutans]MCG2612742.1 YegP family protein [Terrimonas ginsenosidimutans]